MRVLVVAWDSGGGVEVVETAVRRIVARGHQVRTLGTEGLRAGLEAAGAEFRPYRYAPDNDRSRPETDLIRDWEATNPLDAFARIRDRVMFGPARRFCRDVVEELEREPADVVVVDVMIASALCGAEAAGVPRVLLMHALYGIPRPGATPMGAGFLPATDAGGRLRDRVVNGLTRKLFATGLPPLNEAREELGLAPYESPLELFDRTDRILVCTSPSYEFGAETAPANVAYVGPQFEDTVGGAWESPFGDGHPRPLVLVGLSSTFMDQRQLLQRSADALGRLPVHGLVTTGPAVDPAEIVAPDNVVVTRWVPHADVLPHCAAVVTHGGHGTVLKALRAGVPLVVAPLGRDQPDNAARVVAAGAGVRVGAGASVAKLERAVARAVWDPTLRDGAGRMAVILAAERDDGLLVDRLEEVVASVPRRLPTTPDWGPLPEPPSAGEPELRLPAAVGRSEVDVSDGGRIELFEAGTGPTVVLLHGMGLSADIWARQLPDLARDHRVVAWNQRGCGASTAGTGGFGLERLLDDLFEVLAARDVRDAVLVGHSVAGMVVIEAAVQRPDDLARHAAGLVLVSTTGGTVPAIGSSAVKDALFGSVLSVEQRWHPSTRLPAMAKLGAWFSFGRGNGTPGELALVRRLTEAADPAAGPEQMRLMMTYDARGRFGAIQLPVRVVAGTWDSFLPTKHAELLAASIPGAVLVPFPKSGHMLMLEQSEGFNAVVRGFSADPVAGGRGPVAVPDRLVKTSPSPSPGDGSDRQGGRRDRPRRPGRSERTAPTTLEVSVEPMGRRRTGVRRLNGEDSGFLSLDLPDQPMTSQFLLELRARTGPGGEPRPITLQELTEHVAHRLGEIPPFRWRIVRVPLGLSHHVAVEDTEFDVRRHVERVVLDPSEGDAGLHRICDELSGQHLDPSRPLWQMVLVDGLAGGRQGLVIRFHHCLMDGGPSLQAVERILSGSGHEVVRPADGWRPVPIPTPRQLVADAVRDEARILGRLPSLVARTFRGYRDQQAFERQLATPIAVSPKDTPPCSLNNAFSLRRAHANVDLAMADLKLIRKASGATLNQVLLSLVGGGLRRHLASIGDLPEKPLVSGVPMAFDPPGSTREYGNHFINFVTRLATDVDDPWDRLLATAAASADARDSMEALGGELLCEWLDQVPPFASERLIRRHVAERRDHREVADINVNVSLVRGPAAPLELAGAEVERYHVLGPPNSGCGLSVTALSYVDHLMVNLHANADALPDPSSVARGIEQEVTDLLQAAAGRSGAGDVVEGSRTA